MSFISQTGMGVNGNITSHFCTSLIATPPENSWAYTTGIMRRKSGEVLWRVITEIPVGQTQTDRQTRLSQYTVPQLSQRKKQIYLLTWFENIDAKVEL